MMTRKDYIRISEGLRTARNTIQDSRNFYWPIKRKKKMPPSMNILVGVAEMLADLMQEDDSGFDRDKFMTNAGLSTEILEEIRK